MKPEPLCSVIKTSNPNYDVVQVKYLLSALEGLKHDLREFIEDIPYRDGDWSVNQMYELFDKWFPVFEVKDVKH